MKLKKNAIVVIVDRLGAGFLGPYGNTWLDTPNLNRVAAESCLFEFPLVDSPQLDIVYQSYWHGLHAMLAGYVEPPAGLAELLTQADIQTSLLTDETELPSRSDCRGFANIWPAATPAPLPTAPAQEMHQTQLARLFASAMEQLQVCEPPFLFWIHARAMQGAWDAPMPLRETFADEEDPEPPGIVTPPSLQLADDFDPDQLLGMTQSYAGQVALLDVCLGALLDQLGMSPFADQTLLILTSPRGYPLGEHRFVGDFRPALYGELLHVPWIVRLPDRRFACQRRQSLIQPPTMYATLLDWFELPQPQMASAAGSLLPVVQDEQAAALDQAYAVLPEQIALRTPSWFLRSEASTHELYAKPDDRWEVNEISDRCSEVVKSMLDHVSQIMQTSQSGETRDFPPLPEILRTGPF